MIDNKQKISIVLLIVSIALIIYGSKFGSKKIEQFKTKPTIVLYYANWCGHSKIFLPEWIKFEEYARNNLKHIETKRILCEGDNMSKCTFLAGYPTVLLYKNNEIIGYNGKRDMESLAQFINDNS